MPKPPLLDRLSHSATHQRCWPKKVSDEDEVIPDSEKAEEKSEDDDLQSINSKEPAKKRVKCNSMCHNAKPAQLHFYLGAWQDILEDVKEFYCLWAIKECPFPIIFSMRSLALRGLWKSSKRRAVRSKLVCPYLLSYHILMNTVRLC